MNTSGWAWVLTVGLVLALLTLDFVVAARRPHAVGLREATFWSVFYIGVAVAFGLALWMLAGSTAGTEYFAGWVVEKSLSVDSLFVFVIAAALVMRGVHRSITRPTPLTMGRGLRGTEGRASRWRARGG